MKTTGLTLALLLASAAHAQGNEEKYTAKLAQPFVTAVDWQHDLDDALATAGRTPGRLVFAYFTRSYAP